MHRSMTIPREAARTARSPVGAVTSAAHRLPSGSAGHRSAEMALRPWRIPALRSGARPVGQAEPVAESGAPPGERSPRAGAADRALDIVGRHSGQALDDQLRSTTEVLLGGDFSRVRVHTRADAAGSALALGARAYTIGDDIVFAPGAYAPTTPEGLSTLIHELVHVRQQRRGPGPAASTGGTIAVSDPGDRFEREAEAIARRPLDGQPITRAPDPAIQQLCRTWSARARRFSARSAPRRPRSPPRALRSRRAARPAS